MSDTYGRVQDIELMHMRFALEFTVFAIGAMELCPGDKNDYQFATAVLFLREMQNHLEAISNVSRKVDVFLSLIPKCSVLAVHYYLKF